MTAGKYAIAVHGRIHWARFDSATAAMIYAWTWINPWTDDYRWEVVG